MVTKTANATDSTTYEPDRSAHWRPLRTDSKVFRARLLSDRGLPTAAGRAIAVDGGRHSTADEPTRVLMPVALAPRRVSGKTFVSTARWEGVVLERYATYFAAEVVDLESGERSNAEFELSDVAPHDLQLCQPGGLFYWTIGYETKDSGQRSRSSVLAFRRTGNGN